MELYCSKQEGTPNFRYEVRTHFRVRLLIFCYKNDVLSLIRRCVEFQQPNQFAQSILSHLKKYFQPIRKGGRGEMKLCYIY